jgi:lipoprotein-anchoring transpeptidase ErfK/SrfK
MVKSPAGRFHALLAICAALTLLPVGAADAAPSTEPTTASTEVGTDSTEATTITVPLQAQVGADATPTRGTQIQLTEPPPIPTTTTTTLPPADALPANSGAGRRVVYSKSAQRLWAVDQNGVVIKTHRVSGKQTPLDPRPGSYTVWSRSRYTNSIANPSITWGYMVRFAKGANGGNIGFHEIPMQYGRPVQSVAQLGQALSGGCVRQAVPDAIWMWNWAHLGTVVVVLP